VLALRDCPHARCRQRLFHFLVRVFRPSNDAFRKSV
jgi:hypothetical protein